MIRSVRDRATFAALRSHGVRARAGSLSASYLPGPGEVTEVGFAITKRVGGAVQRNRIRRRVRAILVEVDRDADHHLPRGALLVSAGPQALVRTPQELRNDVHRLLAAVEAGSDQERR